MSYQATKCKIEPFYEQLEPYFKDAFKLNDSRKLILTELSDSAFCENLDKNFGIDALIQDGNNLQPVAIRILSQDYRTFTIRNSRQSGAKTEYEKIVEGLTAGTPYPELCFTAYIVPGQDIRAACIDTKILIDFILTGKAEEKRTRDKNGWQSFYCIEWAELYRSISMTSWYQDAGTIDWMHNVVVF